MSSHESEGESYVSHYLANPKLYGDLDPYGLFSEEELEGKYEEEGSDEEEIPLPRTGDMHVEFRKSSLPNTRRKPKVLFIPSRFLQEKKQELCQRILKLEQEVDDLREHNFMLKRKLDKLPISSTTPTSPPPKKDN
jgi:hypothetical protein